MRHKGRAWLGNEELRHGKRISSSVCWNGERKRRTAAAPVTAGRGR